MEWIKFLMRILQSHIIQLLKKQRIKQILELNQSNKKDDVQDLQFNASNATQILKEKKLSLKMYKAQYYSEEKIFQNQVLKDFNDFAVYINKQFDFFSNYKQKFNQIKQDFKMKIIFDGILIFHNRQKKIDQFLLQFDVQYKILDKKIFDKLQELEHIKVFNKTSIDIQNDEITNIKEIEDNSPFAEKNTIKFCLTRLLQVFVLEWSQSEVAKNKYIKTLLKQFNTKRPDMIGYIQVSNLQVNHQNRLNQFPRYAITLFLQDVAQMKQNIKKFLYDFDFTQQGQISFQIATEIYINYPRKHYKIYPITVNVQIQSITGKLRVCFVNSVHGKSWISFIGEPAIRFNIDPQFGSSHIKLNNIPFVKETIQQLIIYHVQKSIHPNKITVKIPLTFKSKKK